MNLSSSSKKAIIVGVTIVAIAAASYGAYMLLGKSAVIAAEAAKSDAVAEGAAAKTPMPETPMPDATKTTKTEGANPAGDSA